MSDTLGHTPGPWDVGCRRPYIIAVTRPDGRAQGPHVISAGEPTGGNGWPDSMDEANPHGFTPGSMKANARLIAAAPELLAEYHSLLARLAAASKDCARGHSQVAEELCHEFADFKSPAITKATGKESA